MNQILFGVDQRTTQSFNKFYEATNKISQELKAGSDTAIKAIGNAFEIGADSYAKTLSEAAKKHSKSLQEDYKKVHETEKALQDLEKKANDELLQTQDENQKNQIREKLEEERKGLQRELAKRKDFAERLSGKASREFERQQERTLARIEEQQKILKEANEASAKLMRTHIQEGLEFGGERLSDIISLSQEDFVKGISSVVNKLGTVTSRAAARGLEGRSLAGKDNSGAMGQVLTALTKIGPVLIGVTAAFAGFAALAFAADGQIREFNKTILDAAPAVDLFGKTVFESGFNLKTSLKEIRDAALDFSNITKVSAQDALNLITKFNDSGIALSQLRSEFSNTGNATEAYTEMAMFANTYTRALGISVDELTTHFSFMFGKMGMGLDSIKDSFGAITAGAQVAGLNVKDFFTAVSQTTSGLALYNIRLDKTAAQLLGLMKIMDKQKAQELLESKEMGNQGIEERFKAGMLVGGRGQKLFQAALSSQMENFTKDYGDTFGEVLKDKLDPEVLAKMSGKELGSLQQKLIEEGSKKGLAPEQAAMAGQRLEKLRKVAQGAQGGAMNMAKGMSGLTGLSDVAMRLTQGMSLVGAQSLDEMGYIARKNFEDLSGISGEKFDEMASLLNRYQAAFPEETIPQILERMASGEVPMTEADKKLFDEVSKQKPESMEKLAQDQIDATTSVADILKNKIASLLEHIGNWLSDIFDGLTSTFDAFGDAKKKREERETVKNEIKGYKQEGSDVSGKIKKIEAEIAQEMAKPEGERAKTFIEGNKLLVEQLKGELAGLAEKAKIGEKTLEKMSSGSSRMDAEREILGVEKTKFIKDDRSISGKREVDKSFHEMTAEIETSREDAAKNAAVENKKREEEAKEQKKRDEELNKGLKIGNARTQLMQAYGADAVMAALGGDVKALKAKIGKNKGGIQTATEAGISLQDFIYRGDGTRGTINPINKRDEFFGAKPGGAIDKAINGGGGGVVNIYISGDEAKVYNVVKRVIQESGLRAPAGGR